MHAVTLNKNKNMKAESNKIVNVMVVEDEATSIFIAERALQEHYNVDCVTNGYDAILALKTKQYDVILMDINLGDEQMDGIRTMRQIRQGTKHPKVKIIAVTAHSDARDWYRKEGFDELYLKPVAPRIISIIDNLLSSDTFPNSPELTNNSKNVEIPEIAPKQDMVVKNGMAKIISSLKSIVISAISALSVTITFALTAIICISSNTISAQANAKKMNENILKPNFNQVEKKSLPVRFGLGAETYISGNAHGAFYSARVNISKGKSVFGLGPCLQKRSLALNGVKLSYSYLLSGNNNRYDEDELKEIEDGRPDLLELRALCYVQYTHKAQLCYNASRVETITNNESHVNFNQFRTSTTEIAFCAELDINLNGIKIRNYMGFNVFYHSDYTKNMYRPKCATALVFGTGFIIPNL